MSLFSTLLATTPATSAATSRVVRGTCSGAGTDDQIVTIGGLTAVVGGNIDPSSTAAEFAAALNTWINQPGNLALIPALSCAVVSSVNFDITCIAGAAANSLQFLTNDPALVPVGAAMVVTGIGAGTYTYRGMYDAGDGAGALYNKEGQPTSNITNSLWDDKGTALWEIFNGASAVVNSTDNGDTLPSSATWTGSTVLADFAIERNGANPSNILITGLGAGEYDYSGIGDADPSTAYYNLKGQPPSYINYTLDLNDVSPDGRWNLTNAVGDNVNMSTTWSAYPQFAAWTGSVVTAIKAGSD